MLDLRPVHTGFDGGGDHFLNGRSVLVVGFDVCDDSLEILDAVTLRFRDAGFDDVGVELADVGVDTDIAEHLFDERDGSRCV